MIASPEEYAATEDLARDTLLAGFERIRKALYGHAWLRTFDHHAAEDILSQTAIEVFLVYLIFTGYIYINKRKFLESFKHIVKFKKFSYFLVLILVFLITGVIVRYGLVLSTSIYSMGGFGYYCFFYFYLV